MKTLYGLTKQFMLICLCLFISCVIVIAQSEDEGFEPQSGQSGKDVVWVPTTNELVDVMLDLAELTSDDFLVDLGSGDGRTVIAAAKRGARARGVEFNPKMVELSRKRAEEAGVSDRATFIEGDLFEADISDATVITLFLLTSINLKLRPTLLELKPGTRIVTNTFTMEAWEADSTASVDDPYSTWGTALLWIVPAKVTGTWRLSQGTLTLDQEFQMLSGTLNNGNATIPIEDGRMRGTQISFNAGGADYMGTVNGSRIEGTVISNGSNRTWTATLSSN
ncbi:class I SAM-dependent methyltransferase [Candidatus Latescibacterota bacterium]